MFCISCLIDYTVLYTYLYHTHTHTAYFPCPSFWLLSNMWNHKVPNCIKTIMITFDSLLCFVLSEHLCVELNTHAERFFPSTGPLGHSPFSTAHANCGWDRTSWPLHRDLQCNMHSVNKDLWLQCGNTLHSLPGCLLVRVTVCYAEDSERYMWCAQFCKK